MVVPFDTLPDSSRIWVYPTRAKLDEETKQRVLSEMTRFLEEWTAHGNMLKAGCTILHNHFLVLGLDESYSGASGCSIDASVKAIRAVGEQIGITFLDQSLAGFYSDGAVNFISFTELGKSLKEGKWDASTLTFNPMVSTRKDIDENWIIPADQSWLRRYLDKAKITS